MIHTCMGRIAALFGMGWLWLVMKKQNESQVDSAGLLSTDEQTITRYHTRQTLICEVKAERDISSVEQLAKRI